MPLSTKKCNKHYSGGKINHWRTWVSWTSLCVCVCVRVRVCVCGFPPPHTKKGWFTRLGERTRTPTAHDMNATEEDEDNYLSQVHQVVEWLDPNKPCPKKWVITFGLTISMPEAAPTQCSESSKQDIGYLSIVSKLVLPLLPKALVSTLQCKQNVLLGRVKSLQSLIRGVRYCQNKIDTTQYHY